MSTLICTFNYCKNLFAEEIFSKMPMQLVRFYLYLQLLGKVLKEQKKNTLKQVYFIIAGRIINGRF